MFNYVLDACALIAYLNNEEGAEKIERILIQSFNKEVNVYIHINNLFEVHYDTVKRGAIKNILEFFELIHDLPVEIVKQSTNELLDMACLFKCNYRVSFADSFALGLSKTRNAQLITSDHHEFDIIERDNGLNILWLR